MTRISALLVPIVMFCTWAGLPCDAPATELTAEASIEQVLDALYRRTDDLQAFRARIRLVDEDAILGDSTARTGWLIYQSRPGATARLRVRFEQKLDGKHVLDEVLEYRLLDGWLVDRNYRTTTEVRRQVVAPGERVNLLKLGEGKLPLPIGQSPDDVHREFEVHKIEPDAGDPAGLIHLRLVPRQGTAVARQFKTLDFWVDPSIRMPVRMDALDINESSIRRTELTELQINPPIGDADFELPPVDEKKWNIHVEAGP
jgi:hypothetical protein